MRNRSGTDDLEKANIFNAVCFIFLQKKTPNVHSDIKLERDEAEEKKNRQRTL